MWVGQQKAKSKYIDVRSRIEYTGKYKHKIGMSNIYCDTRCNVITHVLCALDSLSIGTIIIYIILY